MEVSDEQLRAWYESLKTDELVDLHRSGELTDLASSVLSGVLTSRGLTAERLQAIAENQGTEASLAEKAAGSLPPPDRDLAGPRPFVARLWRGEIPLPETYWGFGVGGGVALSFLSSAVGPLGVLSTLALAVFSIFFWIFITVAIWRSANRYRGPEVWARLAKFGIFFGWFLTFVALLRGCLGI